MLFLCSQYNRSNCLQIIENFKKSIMPFFLDYENLKFKNIFYFRIADVFMMYLNLLKSELVHGSLT